MITAEVIYKGELRCNLTHLKSGEQIYTDAPEDNHGKGESFSPTDLVAAALGSCILTVIGIEAQKLNISLDGAKTVVSKKMGINPRKIARIAVEVTIPDNGMTTEQKDFLVQTALDCPVGKSLHPDLAQDIRFTFLKES